MPSGVGLFAVRYICTSPSVQTQSSSYLPSDYSCQGQPPAPFYPSCLTVLPSSRSPSPTSSPLRVQFARTHRLATTFIPNPRSSRVPKVPRAWFNAGRFVLRRHEPSRYLRSNAGTTIFRSAPSIERCPIRVPYSSNNPGPYILKTKKNRSMIGFHSRQRNGSRRCSFSRSAT